MSKVMIPKASKSTWRKYYCFDGVKVFEFLIRGNIFFGVSLLGSGTAINSCGGTGGGGSTLTLQPTDDSYVRDGSGANKNYGSATVMNVKTDSIENNRHTYLKFYLTGVSSRASAKLRIYGDASYNTTLTAYETGASWSESTVTRNNKLASGNMVGSVFMNNTKTYYEIILTAYTAAQLAGNKALSIVLREDAGKYITLNSSENSTNRPELVITQN
ncbi:DNRLRE domain-containing protein [Paenibacillus sp. F411]|uniref:CBM96 family carbohydrate-binding protein n=1 Tax=Paenibacillus sp. F411 TaxID=2820239 RepID=UPI001AAE675A|nr:DNRLRE domain-containing protein [Paenibacillus sp. F411]MBO2944606.1 DNRLRE domain-containing protein [Paenibacillus sp. F411]